MQHTVRRTVSLGAVAALSVATTALSARASSGPAGTCDVPKGAVVLARNAVAVAYSQEPARGPNLIYRGCARGHKPRLIRPKPCPTNYLTLCRLNAFHAVDRVIGFGETIIYTDAVQLRVAVRDLNDGRLLFSANAITQQFPAPTNRTYGIKTVRFTPGARTVAWIVRSPTSRTAHELELHLADTSGSRIVATGDLDPTHLELTNTTVTWHDNAGPHSTPTQ